MVEYFCLLMLFTCFLPSLADNAQVLMNFKTFLSNADALSNWGNQSIGVCSWTGVLCFNQSFHGLRLEHMGLGGTVDVDTLHLLSNLNSFSVINNNFEGPMPEFKKLVNLRALFLSNNKFSGEIPDDAFDGMKRLKRVFLAENEFTGHIPTSLAQLPKLFDVDIHGNSFEGNIPEFQQTDFRVFNLSYNNLEGRIPESLSSKDPTSFAGKLTAIYALSLYSFYQWRLPSLLSDLFRYLLPFILALFGPNLNQGNLIMVTTI